MSVHAVSWVLSESEARGSNRLVLIVLADHASPDGTDSYPSVETIARQARISERSAQYALRALERDGHIARGDDRPNGTRSYVIHMRSQDLRPAGRDVAVGGGAESAPPGVQRVAPRGAKSRTEGVQRVAPEPTTEQKTTTTTSLSSSSDLEVDRLCELFSDLTRARTETPPSSPRYRVTAGWRTEMDRLLRIDGRDPAEVEAVIRWVDQDDFWAANVLSVPKLRAKFDQLRATANRRRPPDRLGVAEMSRWAAELDAAEKGAA